MIDRAAILAFPVQPEPEPAPQAEVKLRLDLGCGQTNEGSGWTGVDIASAEGVDVVHDLFSFPWPFESDSVDEIRSIHFYEHVPARVRPRFMEEMYRILRVGAGATLVTPYWASNRSVQDFTHEWPPICAESYLYFNRKWREENKLTHGVYDIKCDFDLLFPGQSLDPNWVSRHPEAQMFAGKHYVNVVHDLIALLVKRA